MDRDDPVLRAATRSLSSQRDNQVDRLKREREKLVEIVRQLVTGIVKLQLPGAAKLVFKVVKTDRHWAGQWMALVAVLDEKGAELPWEEALGDEDRELLADLQKDLTDCFAIPRDQVAVSYGC